MHNGAHNSRRYDRGSRDRCSDGYGVIAAASAIVTSATVVVVMNIHVHIAVDVDICIAVHIRVVVKISVHAGWCATTGGMTTTADTATSLGR